ncbi:MAG: gliding motility-associated C-terminal domain-containing protein [Tannerella sp.]|jgi:gliding motility-associated-like protein|nr:gliding motility-associated C-terminal domain-containing protein [Tannerella sp.]
MDIDKKRKFGGLLAFMLFVCSAFARQYGVTGGGHTPLLAENNTGGRIQVYLVYGMENVQISYTSSSTSHQWYRYKTRALDDSEIVSSTQTGTTSYVTNVEEGYGYYVKENENVGMNYFVWIIDYSKYEFFIRSLSISPDVDECVAVGFDGDADIEELAYYTPSGSRGAIKREFELSYVTLKWNEALKRFSEEKFVKIFNTDPFSTTFPSHSDDPMLLTDTEITLKGDLFARYFGVEKSISIPYEAKAIQVYADTLIVSVGSGNMEGSEYELCAPAVIKFTAYANRPVASRFVWKVYNSEDPDNLLIQYSAEELEYTFDRVGTFIVKLEASDRSGFCSNDDEHAFQISITETEMAIPNAFSPGCTPGINDIFKVRCKSVIKFQGWVFNRWGTEMFHWTDPLQGWDGKYRGKYAPPGAYYYLIEYTGTDGKKRVKKGDINVFRSKEIDTEIRKEEER